MISKQFIICGFYLLLFASAVYPLRNYSLQAHNRAFRKATFLVCFSAAPALLGFFVSTGTLLVMYGELFIYAAAFLPPVLYTYYERANDERPFRKVIKGDWFTITYALLIFVATAVIFGAFKANPQSTITEYPNAPSIILIVTIILWYSTIAAEEHEKNDFVRTARLEEATFINKVTR